MICARTKFIHEVSGDNRKIWNRVERKYIDLCGMCRVCGDRGLEVWKMRSCTHCDMCLDKGCPCCVYD